MSGRAGVVPGGGLVAYPSVECGCAGVGFGGGGAVGWTRSGLVAGGPVLGWSRWVSVVPFWGWIGVLRGERVGCGGVCYRGVDGHISGGAFDGSSVVGWSGWTTVSESPCHAVCVVDESLDCIFAIYGWLAGVSVAVGWSRSDGHGGNRSGSGTIYSVRWFGVVGLEPFWATNAYVSGISYPSPSASGPQGAFSWGARSSVRAWSIWSLGVRRRLRGRCGIFHLLSYGLRKLCIRR